MEASTAAALDRVRARVAAAAPAPVQPPAEPVAPPQEDQASQLSDLQAVVSELADRVTTLEQAGIEDAMDGLSDWADPDSMTAAAAGASTAE